MGAVEHKSKDGASPLSNKDLLPPRPCTGCLRQPCRGEGLLQAAVLFHLPGCQLCIYNILHLWRALLEHHVDLCPDLPGSCGQPGIRIERIVQLALRQMDTGNMKYLL